jgi:serine/threonine protein phosphatase PrpC
MQTEEPALPLRVGARTDRGRVREDNQDRMTRLATPLGDLFLVVDGMGGHEGGARAAEMVVDGFDRALASPLAGPSIAETLRRAAGLSNEDIHRLAFSGEPGTLRMGATAVVALRAGNALTVGHVGDCRAYLFRDGRLRPLTRDHSLVQRLVDSQQLTETEARVHPDSNVVTRAFGQGPAIELEVAGSLEVRDGDLVLLCSDGLSGCVDDVAIERAMASAGTAQQTADALVELALAAGGEDNVTVQVLQFARPRAEELPSTGAAPEPPPGFPPAVLPWVLAIAILAAVAAFLYWPR